MGTCLRSITQHYNVTPFLAIGTSNRHFGLIVPIYVQWILVAFSFAALHFLICCLFRPWLIDSSSFHELSILEYVKQQNYSIHDLQHKVVSYLHLHQLPLVSLAFCSCFTLTKYLRTLFLLDLKKIPYLSRPNCRLEGAQTTKISYYRF